MEYLNRIELRGRVGSHMIELGNDGLWRGQFDLHVVTKGIDGNDVPMVFDCRVREGRMNGNLGAGISGRIVQLSGRLVPYGTCTPRVDVVRLSVLDGDEIGTLEENRMKSAMREGRLW